MIPFNNTTHTFANITDPAEKAFALTFKQAILEIGAQNNILTHFIDNVLETVNTFIRGKCEPGAYFDFINNGAFKECYDLSLPGWIIKFCSESNNTSQEHQIINLAAQYGCKELFIPTYFIDLPFTVNACYLEGESPYMRYNENYHTFYPYSEGACDKFDALQIQPLVSIVKEKSYTTVERDDDFPILFNDGTPLNPDFLYYMDLNAKDWVEAAIAAYGDEVFRNFIQFAEDCHISDLHSGNIGYQMRNGNKYPVIIDWLSKKVL